MKYFVIVMLMILISIITPLNTGIDIKVIIKECEVIIKRDRKVKALLLCLEKIKNNPYSSIKARGTGTE